ncbi:putative ribonuclease H-like domain-containing protein [Tanacetum coccineum]
MPDLEDDSNAFPNDGIFSGAYDDEDVGAEADFNNMDNTIDVSPIPTLRVYKDYPKGQILGDPKSAVQTRGKIQKASSVQQALTISQALEDESCVEAMQEELLQFKLHKVWILVDFPFGKKAIGTKWVFRNKRDERSIVVKNKASLVAQGFRQEEGIDYYEVFAPVARIEAIRLFLAFASFKGFLVYQMDVKSAFLYATIREEVYVHRPLGFVDLAHPNKVYKVKQQPDRIFITTTPIESNKPLVKDEDGIDIDVHVYRSMIGSLMYLTVSRPDIMFAVYACARFQVTPKASHLNAVKRIFRYLKHQPKLGLWYPRDSPFELEAFLDSDYGGASLDRKSTTGGCQFLGRRLISWQCKKQTIVANSTTEAEYVAAANCCGQVLWIQNQMMDYGFNFMNTKIHIDNKSTICIVKNHVYHSRTKHIEIRHHFIRDCYEKRLIDVIKIHTDANVADLLTKGFDVTRFNFLVLVLVVRINTDEDKHEFEDGWKLCYLQVNSGSLQVNSGRQKLILICHINTEFKMANLRYSNKHNMVAFLKKPTESVGFTQIVDFLKGTSLMYALTHNPTIYDSLVKQFWQTATVRTLSNGIQELVASIDNKVTGHIKGTEIPQSHGPTVTPVADEATTIGIGVKTEGATTKTSGLDAGMDSGNIHESLLRSHEAPLPEGNTSGSAKDSLNLKELMDIVPKLVLRIDNLEKELQQTKSTYRKAVLTLVERVKLLEAALKRKSMKVILSESEDEETKDQGRKI